MKNDIAFALLCIQGCEGPDMIRKTAVRVCNLVQLFKGTNVPRLSSCQNLGPVIRNVGQQNLLWIWEMDCDNKVCPEVFGTTLYASKTVADKIYRRPIN